MSFERKQDFYRRTALAPADAQRLRQLLAPAPSAPQALAGAVTAGSFNPATARNLTPDAAAPVSVKRSFTFAFQPSFKPRA